MKFKQMKNLLFNLIILVLIHSTLSSCSDNTVLGDEPAVRKDYLPLSIGNYWIYSSKMQNGQALTDSSVVIDSVFIDRKAAFKVAKFRDGLVLDTVIYSKDDLSIYRFSRTGPTPVEDFEPYWQIIADFKSSTWNLYIKSIPSYPYEFLDTLLMARYDYAFNGFAESDEQIEAGGTTYQTKHFRIKYDSRISFEYFFETDTVTIEQLNPEVHHFWYAKDVGLVKFRIDTTTYLLRAVPQTKHFEPIKITLPGMESILERHSLIK